MFSSVTLSTCASNHADGSGVCRCLGDSRFHCHPCKFLQLLPRSSSSPRFRLHSIDGEARKGEHLRFHGNFRIVLLHTSASEATSSDDYLENLKTTKTTEPDGKTDKFEGLLVEVAIHWTYTFRERRRSKKIWQLNSGYKGPK